MHNVYNQVQVQLLMKSDEIEDVPEFDEVFRDDDSDVRHSSIRVALREKVPDVLDSGH